MFSTLDSFHDIPEKYTHFLAFNALTVSHFSLSCNQIYRPPALLRWPHLLERRTPSIFIKVSCEERKVMATCGLTPTVFPHFALQESCTFSLQSDLCSFACLWRLFRSCHFGTALPRHISRITFACDSQRCHVNLCGVLIMRRVCYFYTL